jgi:hypothetical protein
MKTKVIVLIGLLIAMFGGSGKASADDLGCQVILCFGASAIGGWQKVAECVPPVKKALRKMLRGSWKPRCADAGNAEKGEGTFVREGREEFEDCAVAHGQGWIASVRGVDEEPELARLGRQLQPKSLAVPVCLNTQTGDEVIRHKNPTPDYFDVFIDGKRHDRIFWDESQAAMDQEVQADE